MIRQPPPWTACPYTVEFEYHYIRVPVQRHGPSPNPSAYKPLYIHIPKSSRPFAVVLKQLNGLFRINRPALFRHGRPTASTASTFHSLPTCCGARLPVPSHSHHPLCCLTHIILLWASNLAFVPLRYIQLFPLNVVPVYSYANIRFYSYIVIQIDRSACIPLLPHVVVPIYRRANIPLYPLTDVPVTEIYRYFQIPQCPLTVVAVFRYASIPLCPYLFVPLTVNGEIILVSFSTDLE